MPLTDSVILCECWARDGLQSMPGVVSTEHKLEMIANIMASGVQKLEVTSFSNPKLLPQFADAEDILRRMPRPAGVSSVVLMPNERGFDRFEICQKEGYGADEIILMISASEAHNLANFRMTHSQAKHAHAGIMARADKLGVKVIGCAGTVYGCPIAGDVAFTDVADLVRFYVDHGAATVMLGDTTGAANPLLVRERVGALRELFPEVEFIAHFHETRGTGIVNTFAALELGLRYVDASLGAIGGQPATSHSRYQHGFTGNVSTEDLVCMLEECGVDTGLDLDRVLQNGRRAEDILDQRLRSNVIGAGRVNHEPRAYAPQAMDSNETEAVRA
jgi:hydroxymethylglutaryl-CoA lyase